ncbi:HAD superfamily hydrolase (TIGR01458 family) [Methanocalculus alkaliphilus]|uniref:TIGR01458 family HAD-type hydrolase n=1 Tax=Methanocalculus alkaliphilus TaxID=768730 RepID=UPI00209E9B67|nr:TIGR01458 family HAD-type hydrolase [Methanocalculus alkaliphilus]MCP1715646.1 HAD superfamily hydrolase (TIGR01458 family) [Methanocalculus alkaliphilus]
MQIEALIIDIDGVVAIGGDPIPGAAEAIGWLEEAGVPYRFLSNSTQRSREGIAERLNRNGLSIHPELISTPIVAAIRLLKEKGISSARMLVTDAAKEAFHTAGISDGDGAVIIGDAGEAFTFQKLNEAFRLITDGAPLIALERDRYWMAEDGLTLSAGPFVAALEYAAGREAEVLGKPSPDAFLSACSIMGVSPDATAMIGDDIRSDVGGAQAAGLTGVLVRTGKYSAAAVQESGITPDLILGSIADIPEIFRRR